MNKGLARGNRNAWRLALLPDGTLFLPVVQGGVEGVDTNPGGLYRSNNSAESCQRIELPNGKNSPNDLVFDPADPCRLYLSCWPTPVDGKEHGGGLLRSE